MLSNILLFVLSLKISVLLAFWSPCFRGRKSSLFSHLKFLSFKHFDHLASGEERAGLCASHAFVCLFCTYWFLSFFSSSWCQWLAAVCECGTPWTFIIFLMVCISCKIKVQLYALCIWSLQKWWHIIESPLLCLFVWLKFKMKLLKIFLNVILSLFCASLKTVSIFCGWITVNVLKFWTPKNKEHLIFASLCKIGYFLHRIFWYFPFRN